MDRGVSTLISILAAGSLTVAGCSAAGGQAQNGQSEQPLQTGIGQSGAKDGRDAPVAGRDGLPPGVLPPREPAQPGDARLGPDGHYDYAASDFILTNPCDDPEIMAKLEKLGQRESKEFSTRFSGWKQSGCVLGPDGSGPISVWFQAANQDDFRKYESPPTFHKNSEFQWTTTRQTGAGGIVACVASVETERGSFGFTIDATNQSFDDFHAEACSLVNELIIEYMGDAS